MSITMYYFYPTVYIPFAVQFALFSEQRFQTKTHLQKVSQQNLSNSSLHRINCFGNHPLDILCVWY